MTQDEIRAHNDAVDKVHVIMEVTPEDYGELFPHDELRYTDWSMIKDPKFHKLHKQFVAVLDEFEDYINDNLIKLKTKQPTNNTNKSEDWHAV